MKAPRRLITAVALVAAAATALTGCVFTGDRDAASPAPSRTPITEGVSAELLPFYGQELDWQACEGADSGAYDCTTVRAPRDWDDPAAGELELAVVRRAADSGEALGSLLVNPGGPGASGYDLVADSAQFAVGSVLADAYDVIGFDPRGVGRSSAVACFDAAGTDAYFFDIPAAPRGTPEWEAELTARNEQFAAACEDNSDGILPYITTEFAARDMDLLRAVLGDEKLNYLGYSYGTFLGATYAKLYPEKVGRLVLDGAIDPSVPSLDVSTTQAVGFESALRAFMAACVEEEDCPFRGTVDDAMTDLATLLAGVDATPLPASDGRQLGADTLMTGIIAALYSEENWSILRQALAQTLQGNPQTAFLLADFYYARNADGQYEDNSSEAFRAYNCMDYPVENDPEAEAAATARIAAEAPTVAPYWEGVDGCAVWPYPPTGTRGEITADGAAPMVVIGTTNDPATPYEWSVSLADQLASGVLITREGEGHTGFQKGNDCIDSAVESFFVDGTVPDDGLVCQ
ncbi:alpha/beta hydrolase [Microbacterium sp. cf332]|uniref:alpha/beta hydrolase n=1 Tax=Microbacterium sp. cf332 TaxID=1761804 RepID=UPI00088C984B|nr:alpha/beta hydrolase [Microbacterium sp. cf332]SDQ84723.1 alpha/beta hydrolase fold [Microbacterium sp. cf332]